MIKKVEISEKTYCSIK